MDIKALIFGKPKEKTTDELASEKTKEAIKDAYESEKDAALNRASSRSLYIAATAISVARFFAVACMLSFAIIAWMVSNPPKIQPFAVTPSGRIIPLQPLSTPIISEDQLLSIAQNDIIQSYTFTFANYAQQMKYLRPKFSSAAFASFQSSLASSKTISQLQNQKLIISAVPVGAPVLVAQGMLNGRLAWHIQMEIAINYASDSNRASTTVTKYVNIVLQRANTQKYPMGVRIIQLYDSTT